MQIKLFTLPLGCDEQQMEEMNHFLRAHKVVDIKKELATIDGNSCWTFCITYLLDSHPTETEGNRFGNKVDYKEVLSAEEFERFSKMRKVRKQMADADAVPAYAIFTDAELAELAKLPVLTIEAMGKVPNIGKKKLEKYGAVFVANYIKSDGNETRGQSDGADNNA